MKLNFFQKIVVALYTICTVLITICLPFTETYRKKKIIVYDFIWSSRADISLSRMLAEFLSLTVISGILFVLLSKLNVPDFNEKKIKKRLRTIIYKSIIALVLIVTCNYILKGYNNYFLDKKHEIIMEIKENEKTREVISVSILEKYKIRKGFMEEVKNHYDLSEYNDNVAKFWESLEVNIRDYLWANRFYKQFGDTTASIPALGYFQYTNKLTKFGIQNIDDLKNFIEINSLTPEDKKNQVRRDDLKQKIENAQKEIKILNSKIIDKQDVNHFLSLFSIFVITFIFAGRCLIIYILKLYRILAR